MNAELARVRDPARAGAAAFTRLQHTMRAPQPQTMATMASQSQHGILGSMSAAVNEAARELVHGDSRSLALRPTATHQPEKGLRDYDSGVAPDGRHLAHHASSEHQHPNLNFHVPGLYPQQQALPYPRTVATAEALAAAASWDNRTSTSYRNVDAVPNAPAGASGGSSGRAAALEKLLQPDRLRHSYAEAAAADAAATYSYEQDELQEHIAGDRQQ